MRPAVARPPFTTEDAQQAGVTSLVADFRSPFPTNDATRTNNLVVATKRINGIYVPPGGTFSLNGILGERTEDKGYADGTVIIDGRLTRGTGGGISQVSTVVYNLAYFAGVDFLATTCEYRPQEIVGAQAPMLLPLALLGHFTDDREHRPFDRTLDCPVRGIARSSERTAQQ